MLVSVWRGALIVCFLCWGWKSAFTETSVLGKAPDWTHLEPFQGKLTRPEFEGILTGVYCPRKEWWAPWIVIEKDKARIRKEAGKDDWFELSFRSTPASPVYPSPAWKSLKGMRIALDPGHIGGKYSEMEGRHFSIDGKSAVKEGDLSLQTAFRLEKILASKGAEVFLVRRAKEPVTSKKPGDFVELANRWAKDRGLEKLEKEEREKLLRKRREMLFYRVSEIRARARLVNESIRPDLVICLHLNASAWKDPDKKELVDRNDFHVLVNGCYMGGELAYDDQRFEMLLRLLSGWHRPEQKLADGLSVAFAEATGLPAFSYKGPNALKIGKAEGVWARNLLANRLYRCPVVFLEPYRANSKGAYERIMAGSYAGTREINGIRRLALVEEYAQAVAKGLMNALKE